MRNLIAALGIVLLASCLPWEDDGVYACDVETGEDCDACDDATGWCRNISAIVEGAGTLYAISGAGNDSIFVGGSNGVILRWTGTRWTRESSGTSEAINSIWAASPSDVFAVGSNWTWLHYDGSAWSRHEELTSWYWPPAQTDTSVTVLNFTAVGGFSDGGSGIVWALDSQGMVNFLSTATWPGSVAADDYWGLYGVIQDGMVAVPVTAPDVTPSNWVNLWGAWSDAQLNSYLVGRHGTIVRDTLATTNWGGVNVISMPDPAKEDLFAIWGNTDTGNFVSVGSTGTVVFFTKAGDVANWTQATVNSNPVTADLFGVCGTSETDVIAVGTGGLVLQWNGTTWTRIAQPFQETLVNVYCNQSHIFAITDQGAILHLRR